MDEVRRAKITFALREYRETALQHNFSLLSILTEGVEAKLPSPNHPETVVQYLRVEELQRHLQGAIPESFKAPREVLSEDVRSSLAVILDGVSHYPVNLAQRKTYFAGIQECIQETNVEVTEFPLADLGYLCTLISGVTGPGLPFHRGVWQFTFVSSIEDEGLDLMMRSVTVPIRDDGTEESYNSLTYI